MTTTIPVFALIILVLLTGLIMAITPWLMPKSECFAVTVPVEAQRDPRLLKMKKTYSAMVAALTAIFCAICAILSAAMDPAGMGFAVVLSVIILALCFIPFAFMLHFRRKVQALKAAEGWSAQAQQSVAFVHEGDAPKAISLAWNLLYIPVALLVVGIGIIGYPQMPDMIPMHADFQGNVNDWAEKSIGVVFGFPVGMVVFMGVIFAFCHLTIGMSKKPTNPASPAASAYAYGMFARAQSIFLLASGLILSLLIGVGFMLSSMQVCTLGQMAGAIMFGALIVVVGAIAMSVVYGQSGSRLLARMTDGAVTNAAMLEDNDEHWKLGIFYFNKDDASLFLPERFGVGWTLNLARPMAWALIIGLVLVTIIFLVVMIVLSA